MICVSFCSFSSTGDSEEGKNPESQTDAVNKNDIDDNDGDEDLSNLHRQALLLSLENSCGTKKARTFARKSD
jgi:hypothetical protein